MTETLLICGLAALIVVGVLYVHLRLMAQARAERAELVMQMHAVYEAYLRAEGKPVPIFEPANAKKELAPQWADPGFFGRERKETKQ